MLSIDISVLVAIIGVSGTLLGVILGWGLNFWNDKRQKKIRLCFAIQSSSNGLDDENMEHLKTKYSESGYCLCCYNVGQTPYLFETLSLRHKNRIIVDCVQSDVDAKAIMPYEHFIYELNMQEYDAILYHCKQQKIKKCKVVAYDISGKKCEAWLDLFLPSLQAEN